jgi:methionyl-tRNA formyltransferase
MKICVTSGSDDNVYAAKLIQKLISSNNNPLLVIRKKKKIDHVVKSKIKNFIKPAKSIGEFDLYLSKICKENNINILIVDNINSAKVITAIKKLEIDIIINCGGGIFKKEIINTPKMGILNAHMGYLPTYRGVNVLEWSLFYNHKIGVTLHYINRGIDTGDILAFKEIPVYPGDNIKTLRARSADINIELILNFFNSSSKMNPIKQNKEDGKQYFIMHQRLKTLMERKIKLYQKSGD